nr:DUF6884 domain-containing protein [Neobacillus sp.]
MLKKVVKFIEQQEYFDWYVISAKYGLLRQHNVVDPYDLTLNNMKASEGKKWSE